jgi:hypothetical protein
MKVRDTSGFWENAFGVVMMMTPIPELGIAKLFGGAVGVRALQAADIGLSGVGITKLVGTVTDAGATRLIEVGMLEGKLGSELLGALPRMLSTARAEGVGVLQISANFANGPLMQSAARMVERAGGVFSSANGGELITFILR